MEDLPRRGLRHGVQAVQVLDSAPDQISRLRQGVGEVELGALGIQAGEVHASDGGGDGGGSCVRQRCRQRARQRGGAGLHLLAVRRWPCAEEEII